MILVPIESAYVTSYSSVIVPLVLSIVTASERLRYDDLLAEKCVFFLPLSHSAPHSLCSHWNFAMKLTMKKLEWVMGLSCSEDRMTVAWVILTVPTCGQTDGFTIDSTSLCVQAMLTHCKERRHDQKRNCFTGTNRFWFETVLRKSLWISTKKYILLNTRILGLHFCHRQYIIYVSSFPRSWSENHMHTVMYRAT